MSLLVNDLQVFLLNISFVFILFLLYLKFVEARINKVTHEILIALISGISIILCMTFTIKLTNGHIFDLRQVPFIIGALYGGRRVALFLYRGTANILTKIYAKGLSFVKKPIYPTLRKNLLLIWGSTSVAATRKCM